MKNDFRACLVFCIWTVYSCLEKCVQNHIPVSFWTGLSMWRVFYQYLVDFIFRRGNPRTFGQTNAFPPFYNDGFISHLAGDSGNRNRWFSYRESMFFWSRRAKRELPSSRVHPGLRRGRGRFPTPALTWPSKFRWFPFPNPKCPNPVTLDFFDKVTFWNFLWCFSHAYGCLRTYFQLGTRILPCSDENPTPNALHRASKSAISACMQATVIGLQCDPSIRCKNKPDGNGNSFQNPWRSVGNAVKTSEIERGENSTSKLSLRKKFVSEKNSKKKRSKKI